MTDKRIRKFFDRVTIEEQASDWLIKLDSKKSITADELAELREWINRSLAHRESLDHLSEVWSNMDVLSRLAVPLGRRDAHLAARFFGASRRWMSARNVAMAATVSMGVFTLALLSDVFVTDRDGSGINSGLFATQIGEIQTLNLNDGSVIQLNTSSQVKIDYMTNQRSIFLDHGEAYFTVAPDRNRPFVVYSNFGSVKAVGTAFQVRVHSNDLEVTVTEGVVELGAVEIPAASGSKGVSTVGKDTTRNAQIPRTFSSPLRQLAAGQKARFNGAEKAIGLVTDLALSEVAIQLSWREGQLTFAGETLDDVITEISRYTNTEVVIIDPEISNIKIGGRFKVGEIEALLEVLQASFDVEVRRVSQSRVELSVASSG